MTLNKLIFGSLITIFFITAATAIEKASDARIKEDSKFGEQTASARFTPATPGQEPKVEVAEVEETTTETTTSTISTKTSSTKRINILFP